MDEVLELLTGFCSCGRGQDGRRIGLRGDDGLGVFKNQLCACVVEDLGFGKTKDATAGGRGEDVGDGIDAGERENSVFGGVAGSAGGADTLNLALGIHLLLRVFDLGGTGVERKIATVG